MSKPTSSRLTPSRKNPFPPPPRLDLDKVLGCQYGHYPWDDWRDYALARGLAPQLAGLGRLLIREAFNHDWPDWLKPACGWRDDGQALLAFALRSPREARRQWNVLFRTDGLRGDHPGRGIEWVYGFLKPAAQRLLESLVNAELKARQFSSRPASGTGGRTGAARKARPSGWGKAFDERA